MIVGLGIDIVAIERMRRMHDRFGVRLAARLLSAAEEREYARAADPARLIAKRFAAKEATAKALGTGVGQGVRLCEMATTHRASGAPELQLEGGARALADRLGVARAHVSVSDERDLAVALVVLEA